MTTEDQSAPGWKVLHFLGLHESDCQLALGTSPDFGHTLYPCRAQSLVPVFGKVSRESLFFLNALLVLFEKRMPTILDSSKMKSLAAAENNQRQMGIILTELFPDDHSFWELQYSRRKLNKIWKNELSRRVNINEEEFVRAIEYVYSPWFIFLDAHSSLGSQNSPETKTAMSISGRHLMAAIHLCHELRNLVPQSWLTTLLISHYSEGPEDSKLARERIITFTRNCLDKALEAVSHITVPAYHELVLTYKSRKELARL